MVCEPATREDVVNAAIPADSVPDPSGVVPSRKFTVPVGVPAAALTVAVKVTVFCSIDSMLLLLKMTDDATWLTVSVATAGLIDESDVIVAI